MQGYLGFLLVFVSVFLILTLIEAANSATQISLSKAIAAERVYQVQMNAKEVIIESIRQGGREGFLAYNSTHHVKFCKSVDPRLRVLCFRKKEADLWIRAGAYIKLASLDTDMFDSSMDVKIFCMDSITDLGARGIAQSVRLGKQNCPGCKHFSKRGKNISEFADQLIAGLKKDKYGVPDFDSVVLPDCLAYTQPEIKPTTPGENDCLDRITLGGVFATSVYYGDFEMSSVSHIPEGLEVYNARTGNP
jgi:hypothetical protein